jgi:hypothetical protein
VAGGSSTLIYPDAVTLVRARPDDPVTVSVGNDTLRYGTVSTNLSSSLAAGQTVLFTSDRYIKTDADGAVLLVTADPWDRPENVELGELSAETIAEIAAQVEIPYNVRSLTGNPAGVSDWGPVINTAIGDGVKHFFFPEEEYVFSTQIDLSGTSGVVFRAESGVVDTVGNVLGGLERMPSYLLWEGTGDTSPLDLSDSVGFCMDKLGLYYSEATFTGITLSLDDSCVEAEITGCDIGSLDAAETSALANISLYNNWINTIERCRLRGAQYNILGDRVGGSFSNAHRINNCRFYSASEAHIGGIGEQWTIHEPVFEMGSEGVGEDTPSIIVPGPHTNALTSRFEITGMWAGDASLTDPWFISDDENPWHATIQGFIGAAEGPIFQLEGGGHLEITAIPQMGATATDEPLIDLGDTTGDALPFSYFKLRGKVTNGEEAIINRAGHFNLDILTYTPLSYSLSQRDISGHERMLWFDDPSNPRPAIAAEAGLGSGGESASIAGQDLAGRITLQNGGGAAAGKQATITLGTPQIASDGFGSLLVQVFPLDADAATALPYAPLLTANTATWELHTKNAIAAEALFGYRVLGI